MAEAGTLPDVIARLEQLDGDLPVDDGVYWFNRLYLEVTRGIAGWLTASEQSAPGFLERLDVLFGGKYFEALDAAADPLPRDYPFHAWKPLFESRHRRDVAPLQFALAGMNAHINHDLAIGVQDVCAEFHTRPDRSGPEHKDYIAVNGLIKQTEAQVKDWLLTGAIRLLDHHFGPIDDAIAVWDVTQAREAAWTHAEVLFELSDSGYVERRYRAVLDRTAGFVGRAILLPVGAFEGRASEVAPTELPDGQGAQAG
jgi:hypothetical protein